MSITRTIGKNTIGDNNKMKVQMRSYERSTHDLSYIWRNTQSPGTLVPFMCEVGLVGDTWEIDLDANVLTHPTVGPLFGSFKLQNDVYTVPMRLYNSWLHNNRLNIGMKMSQILLPQIGVSINKVEDLPKEEDQFTQINPSCLLAYLGLRGYGTRGDAGTNKVNKNAVPLLGYYDIFKNYYANKQESDFYRITGTIPLIAITMNDNEFGPPIPLKDPLMMTNESIWNLVGWDSGKDSLDKVDITYRIAGVTGETTTKLRNLTVTDGIVTGNKIQFAMTTPDGVAIYVTKIVKANTNALGKLPLEQIDQMRDKILATAGNLRLEINQTDSTIPSLYRAFTDRGVNGRLNTANAQYGLCVKTYNSDLYQNWINTDWITGAEGVNAISAVDTTDGNFTMDALNLAKKVYDMLNRIAVSGGTYKDWIETVYSTDYIERCETPVFEGGMSREIAFQEVVSNSASENEPLGTLAGRGTLVGKQKGGKIKIRVTEPSYIIGITSITPRIDYNQGNKFDTNFKSLDDLHKPALDAIGYQDLVTEGQAYWDTRIVTAGYQRRSAGKTVAWVEYMTNVNKTFGNFAINNNEAFMVLNRNYEMGTDGRIKDLTTYIDPAKYNYIFADTSIDAMNFWVQLGVDCKVRRIMSAKVIPNL